MTNRDYIWYVVDFAKRVLNSGIVLSFRKRHPAAYDFIYNRITLSRFSGLPLSILGIAIFSNLFLLFDFTEDTINSKEFIAIDNFIAKFFYGIRTEPVAQGFYYLSKLCDIMPVSILGSLVVIYFLVKRKFHYAAGTAIALVGSGVSIYLGKNIFEIERPHQYAYYQELFFSFPSGHATIAVAFYGLLFYFILRNSTSFKTWGILTGIAFVFWFLIGISRLYLCVHYFTDVIAGYMLGFLWLLLSISVIEWKNFSLRYARTRLPDYRTSSV